MEGNANATPTLIKAAIWRRSEFYSSPLYSFLLKNSSFTKRAKIIIIILTAFSFEDVIQRFKRLPYQLNFAILVVIMKVPGAEETCRERDVLVIMLVSGCWWEEESEEVTQATWTCTARPPPQFTPVISTTHFSHYRKQLRLLAPLITITAHLACFNLPGVVPRWSRCRVTQASGVGPLDTHWCPPQDRDPSCWGTDEGSWRERNMPRPVTYLFRLCCDSIQLAT